MASSDPVADMLTKIRNAGMAEISTVSVPHSNFKERIVEILKEKGFIKEFKKINLGNNKSSLELTLKYKNESEHVIRGIKKISTPGRRIYSEAKDMPEVLNGYGILIVSTSKGVMTGRNAVKQNVGGELICSVW